MLLQIQPISIAKIKSQFSFWIYSEFEFECKEVEVKWI